MRNNKFYKSIKGFMFSNIFVNFLGAFYNLDKDVK